MTRDPAQAELLAQLVEDGYDAVIPESAKKPKTAANADDDASDDEEAPKQIEEPDDLRTLAKGYDYLLSMRLWALTRERVDALRGELSEKDGELRTLQATATTDLWLTDLQALEEQLGVLHEGFVLDAKHEALVRHVRCKSASQLVGNDDRDAASGDGRVEARGNHRVAGRTQAEVALGHLLALEPVLLPQQL